MTMLRYLISSFLLLTVAACGGGGGPSGTAPFGSSASSPGTGSTPSAADLVFVLSANTVANSGTETVVATATAIDANRNAVAGVPVTISVDNNAVSTPSGTVTGANGQLTATIGIGADRTNRTIRVTASTGSISKTVSLLVQDTGGTTTSGGPSDLLLTLGSATISNNGAQSVTATATALDAKRNVLPGVVVSISVDAGATAQPSGTTTNASGVVTAQIGIGSNSTNRTITVTATATGLPPRTATLQVVTSPVTTNPIAADLSLSLSSSTLVNGGTSTVLATVTAVDANRNALAGIPVAISVDNNAVANVSGTVTNSSGVVTAAIGIGADRSNRSITVTASSGSITRSATFAVIGATLSASYSPQVNAASTGNQIEYRLVDANGSPMSAQAISITSSTLPTASGVTDVNGKYTYSYAAPGVAGTLTIVATAAGDTRTQTIVVQAPGGNIPVANPTPQSASLTPTPSVVSVNAVGSTTNQVELRALFLGPNNAPVSNVRVRFSVAAQNSSDGVATQLGGSTYAYSDATGVARGTFTPGQRSSPTNGVTVQACWDVNDFSTTAACPANRLITNTLTIASEALSVNIRTNNVIKRGTANLTYIKEFVVMVVDAAGQAKPDVLITPSVDLTAYYKGVFVFTAPVWTQRLQLASTENYSWDSVAQAWVKGAATGQPMCPNEDVNRNGVREAGTFVAGGTPPALAARQEDLNWNGELDPRKSDVAIKMVGSARTDANGLAIVQIEYGQNVASWVDYVITVTASGISGTEARARYTGLLYGLGNLPYPAADVTDQTIPPPFVVSPYGRGSIIPAVPATQTTPAIPAIPTGSALTPTEAGLRLALVGMPGCGKSTVGRHLARQLGLRFIDSDAAIEQRIGMPIRDYFAAQGEAAFRDVEQDVIDALAGQAGTVMATGGGAVLRPSTRDALHSRSHVFYLRSTPEELHRRLRHDKHRPLLQVADPLRKLRDLYRERDPLYRRTAHFVVEAVRPSVPALMGMVLMQLELAGLVDPGQVPSAIGVRETGD